MSYIVGYSICLIQWDILYVLYSGIFYMSYIVYMSCGIFYIVLYRIYIQNITYRMNVYSSRIQNIHIEYTYRIYIQNMHIEYNIQNDIQKRIQNIRKIHGIISSTTQYQMYIRRYGMATISRLLQIKLQVSFAKEPYKRGYILQKRPTILKSLQIVATPYQIMGYIQNDVQNIHMMHGIISAIT